MAWSRAILSIAFVLVPSTPGWSLDIQTQGSAQAGRTLELEILGIPEVENPFDPDVVRVDLTLEDPGGTSVTIPAFWHQDYRRQLVEGAEVLTPEGTPRWLARYMPVVSGIHRVAAQVSIAGAAPEAISAEVGVAEAPPPLFAGVATNGQHFALGNGQPLILVGHCVCWPGRRGTYDYEEWFQAMAEAGENYARLWMAPWAFGIETEPGTLTRYRLDRAWQLDQVFRLAEQHGIYLMLCLDYHGMFEVEPDYWGGNNYWPRNPYHTAQGGPCTTQLEFFTSSAAKAVYQKRLRYLVARYSHSPQLLAWQFFNEIDNVYRYLSPPTVALWHRAMGDWLKANDPYRHLVTTSLTGGSDRPEIWTLPQMDFAMFHSYNLADPALGLSQRIRSALERYRKPIMIGEYGVNWQGWTAEDDPYRRALRQGVWAGLLGGSVGTSMSWWWEQLHRENAYPLYRAINTFLDQTRLGRNQWEPLELEVPASPPVTVGDPLPAAQPFDVRLHLNSQWGALLPGRMAVPDPDSASESEGNLNAFVHGTSHPELRIPFEVHAWLAESAALMLHLNSVSQGAIATVRVDDSEVFRLALPNLDGTYQVNNEYNTNLTVLLPPGRRRIEIRNAGADWFFLDWIELDNVQPSEYAGGWQPRPVAIGIRNPSEALLYVAHPKLKYPARVIAPQLDPITGVSITLSNWPAGSYRAGWFDAATAASVGETAASAGDSTVLQLPLPAFSEDIVGRVLRQPQLSATISGHGLLDIRIDGAPELGYRFERSTNLLEWTPAGEVPPDAEVLEWSTAVDDPLGFFRVTAN